MTRFNPTSAAPLQQSTSAIGELKDEDDELDNKHLLDSEGGAAEPQGAAERRATCRKTKRFRLTRQQTRFLMCEFAKGTHPDVARRERLSQEIPGLSPRQVQVWFQNRRAKLRRLTSDDRDCMIRTWALPDKFDNAWALHPTHLAVPAICTPIEMPVDFTPPIIQHLVNPLVIRNRRRVENGEYISPTNLSDDLRRIGSYPVGAVSSPNVLPTLPLYPVDRRHSSHLSGFPDPVSWGMNPFDGQSSSCRHSHLQYPSQDSTVIPTSRDNLWAPVSIPPVHQRSEMLWEKKTIDHNNYQLRSPQLSIEWQSAYLPGQKGGSTGSTNTNQFDGNTSTQPLYAPHSANTCGGKAAG